MTTRAGGRRARATRSASRPASGTCRRSPPEQVVRLSTQLGSVLPFGNRRARLASASMNENHALCSTPEWAEFMESEVLEPVTAGLDLGERDARARPRPGRRDALAPPPREAARRARARPGRRRAPRGRARRHERHGRGRRLDAVSPFPDGVVRLGRLLHDAPPPPDARRSSSGPCARRSASCGPAGCSSAPTASRARGCTSSTKATPTTRSTPRACSSSCRRPASATSWSRSARASSSPLANRPRKGVANEQHDAALPGAARPARAGPAPDPRAAAPRRAGRPAVRDLRRARRPSAVWSDDNWTLHPPVGGSLPGAVWLASRVHVDSFSDLPEELQADFGRVAARVERAILSLGDIAPRPPLPLGRRRRALPRLVPAAAARHARGVGDGPAALGGRPPERARRGAPRRSGARSPPAM